MLYAVLHIIPLRSQIKKEGHKSRDHGIFGLHTKYLMEFDGKMEHVHNLFKMLRSVAPSMVICSLKTRHSRKVRKRYSE